MEEKIKILQLAPRYVFPPDDGGKIGIANITKEFAKAGADITFFTFNDGAISLDDKKLIEPYAKLQLYKHSTINTPLRIFFSLFDKDSLYITKHQSQGVINELEKLVEKNKYDVIHADHSAMAPLAIHLKNKYNIPVGLRLHNIEWTIWQRYADFLPTYSPKRLYIQSQARKLRRNEAEILRNIDIAFAITKEDKQRAMELFDQLNVIVASAGVNTDEWKPDENITKNSNELILATTYRWQHNVDAIRWFIENVLRPLRKKFPSIQLRLLGKDIPADFEKYKEQGAVLTGYVDSVQPYLNKSTIYVSPLFVGGGIRIKILEAMAMELPVVASPVAAEGILANANDGLFISKDADAFIDNISNLLNDENLRSATGKNARSFVAHNFSWSENVAKMILEYYKLKKIY